MIQFFALATLAAAQTSAPATAPAALQQAQPVPEQPGTAPTGTPAPPAPIAAPPAALVPPVPAITPQAAQTGRVLWRNVADGMAVAQLRTLYPQGPKVTYKDDRTVLSDVPIIEGCQAKVNIMHPNGVVKEIVMRGDGAIAGRCSIKIITALSGKYGEPMDKDKVHGSIFGREGKNYIWAHDGVTMQFKRYTGGALGGGGLFAASWEMRYSTADTNIDL